MKNKLKVALVDPVGGHGGMDYYDYGLAYGLGCNNINVLYFTCTDTRERKIPNVLLLTPFDRVWSVNGIVRLVQFIKGYFKAFRFSNKENVQIIHFHFFNLGTLNLLVLVLAYFFRQKKVVTLHDIESFHKGSAKIISKLCLRLLDGVIVHNGYSKDAFDNLFQYNKPLVIIPHGNYLPFVEVLPLPKKNKVINLLFFGQIKDVKGLDILLKAMKLVVKKNPDFKLTIAGRPWKTESSVYENMIESYELSDTVTTHFRYIDDVEVSAFYKNTDIVVLPYKKIYQSGVLLLSWSYGRTAITSDLSPFKEVLTDQKNGFLFKSEDAVSLAECILNLNFERIINATERSNKIIKDKYDWPEIGRKTLQFYQEL